MNTISNCPVIVLFTVNSNESHALLDAFVGKGQSAQQVVKDRLIYNDMGIHGGCRIVHMVCEMGAGGIGASQQRTGQAIGHWQPKAVIAVGIAFGLDETKQQIGDVLVSTQIQDYELGRVNENGTLTPRGDKPSSANILLNRFRQTDINENRRTKDWPKVQFGLILSGQKLVDNLDYRESLKALFTDAIGGEMEAVGLYVSASPAKVDWIVVKAICDWGHNKNQANKDVWQKLAAKNAARVLKAVLDVGELYDDVLSPVEAIGLPADGRGGKGGGRNAIGKNSQVIGGKGGPGGGPGGGRGGDGGGGDAVGEGSKVIGGDGGGGGGRSDGRGGIGAPSPITKLSPEELELFGLTGEEPYGQGGTSPNSPEYDKCVKVLNAISAEYSANNPKAKLEPMPGVLMPPVSWVNERLSQRRETFRVELIDNGTDFFLHLSYEK